MVLKININKTLLFSFVLTKTNIVSIMSFEKTNMLEGGISAMTKLDKKQLEYLSRTIMPELYKRQAQKDDYLEQLKSSLKEAKVKENNEATYAE